MTETEPTQNAVKPSAEGLAAAATRATKKGPPPVHLWNPPFCGDLDMEIRRDGTWFYLGTPIGRAPLVRLFASILKREEGKYFLVTPVEKVGIRVVDAPFVAVDCTVSGAGEGQSLTFTTNVGDEVTAGPEHPIRVTRAADGEPSPYVMVRAGLEALIDRKTFYRLVDIATPGAHDGAEWLGLRSGGAFFPIIPMADL
ncbi:proteophosphoglycan precursor [Rhodobacter xanthinilyticus]|uniref:Proteophosphoglycan n=1 Tax=Rhodobacter xanthinilyticus TaxID=1850250 RepID=A0A1D9MF74_9RHOB|nr:DUF1285 domain-containing protein [Rhodobacter xanthinilyticus]AOZ70486.1 proteophosphoglycan precursor [Rhodobacter xanthinilyticus]